MNTLTIISLLFWGIGSFIYIDEIMDKYGSYEDMPRMHRIGMWTFGLPIMIPILFMLFYMWNFGDSEPDCNTDYFPEHGFAIRGEPNLYEDVNPSERVQESESPIFKTRRY